MRGHPGIYLLAVALAAACLAGCAHQPWSGPISLSTITSQQMLDEKTNKIVTHFEVEILSIQKLGDDRVIYPPLREQETLWLEPGEYRAKVKCDQEPSDKDYAGIMKPEHTLGNDQMLKFTLKIEPEGRVQYLRCEVDNAGKVYVALLEANIIVVD